MTKVEIAAALALLGAVAPTPGCQKGTQNETQATAKPSPAAPRKTMANKETLPDLGKKLGITFPAGSILAGSEREEGMDSMVSLKVLIPAAEWAAFSATLPVKPEDMEPGTGGFLGPDHDFWDPNAAPGIRTGQVQRPGARYLNIGVSEGKGPLVALYIVEHGT